jgi:heme-degrading monooxygenase HmoA
VCRRVSRRELQRCCSRSPPAGRGQVQAIRQQGAYNEAKEAIEPRSRTREEAAEATVDQSGGAGGPASNEVEVERTDVLAGSSVGVPNTEVEMSIVVRYAPVPSSTIEQYDEVIRRLQESGELPADGFDYHVAFHSDGQLLVSEVWDSREQFEAFGKRVMPLLADVALEHSGHPEVFEAHNIIRR